MTAENGQSGQNPQTTRRIEVDALARVEGEGRFNVVIDDGRVVHSEFSIFEPPRYFEALLRGRSFMDAPDITSRICGICPIAYIMSASQAMEDALGVTIPDEIVALRRLLYCGEWIQSHVLHTHMLHAPDFLGLADAIEMAKVAPEIVKNGLFVKKIGNRVMEVIGGRAVHPVNTRVGGFYRAPPSEAVQALAEDLERCEKLCLEALDAFAEFDFPDLEMDYDMVALSADDDYAIMHGRLIDAAGMNIAVSEFHDHFVEHHVAHSNALQGGRKGSGAPYLVGPLARVNLNRADLPDDLQARALAAGLEPMCRNPFKSLLARQIEAAYACREAARLAASYQRFSPGFVETPARAGTGHGCTEAPRGICHHSYTLDDDGLILAATIVPPTSQNQKQIEADLVALVNRNTALDDDALQWRCEQAIRNYDPCISCATHFLDLQVERR